MNYIKLAVPTKGDKGLDDVISDVFGRAKTFTVIDMDKGKIVKVEVIQNPALPTGKGQDQL